MTFWQWLRGDQPSNVDVAMFSDFVQRYEVTPEEPAFTPSGHDRFCARVVELYGVTVVKPDQDTACLVNGMGTC